MMHWGSFAIGFGVCAVLFIGGSLAFSLWITRTSVDDLKRKD